MFYIGCFCVNLCETVEILYLTPRWWGGGLFLKLLTQLVGCQDRDLVGWLQSSFNFSQIANHHLGDELFEGSRWLPMKYFASFGGIAT